MTPDPARAFTRCEPSPSPPGAVLTFAADAADAHARLTEYLTASGALTDPAWKRAVARVPRHAFVPAFQQRQPGGGWHSVTRDTPGYLSGVYADRPLTTQLTDGQPTSSSSQPSLMVMMLEALDVTDGSRVLEVATGTGSVPWPEQREPDDERPAVLGPGGPFGDDSFDFLLSVAVPGVRFASEAPAGGSVRACRAWRADGSWARVERGLVRQGGPVRLWDAVEAAHACYTDHGRPGRQRFGLSVSPGGAAGLAGLAGRTGLAAVRPPDRSSAQYRAAVTGVSSGRRTSCRSGAGRWPRP